MIITHHFIFIKNTHQLWVSTRHLAFCLVQELPNFFIKFSSPWWTYQFESFSHQFKYCGSLLGSTSGQRSKWNYQRIPNTCPAQKCGKNIRKFCIFSTAFTSLCSRNFRNVKLRLRVWKFNCHPILREINFGKIWVSKSAFFTILETLNFEFW